MKDVLIRFEGGPFDGAEEDAKVMGGDLPGFLYVWKCTSCDSIHFDIKDPPEGAVRYRFVRKDARGALYRYGDHTGSDGRGSVEEVTPAEIKEKLVPV